MAKSKYICTHTEFNGLCDPKGYDICCRYCKELRNCMPKGESLCPHISALSHARVKCEYEKKERERDA